MKFKSIANLCTSIQEKSNQLHHRQQCYCAELAAFGLSEEQLQQRSKKHEKPALDFEEDDRAITNNYQYGKPVLFIKKKRRILVRRDYVEVA